MEPLDAKFVGSRVSTSRCPRLVILASQLLTQHMHTCSPALKASRLNGLGFRPAFSCSGEIGGALPMWGRKTDNVNREPVNRYSALKTTQLCTHPECSCYRLSLSIHVKA